MQEPEPTAPYTAASAPYESPLTPEQRKAQEVQAFQADFIAAINGYLDITALQAEARVNERTRP